jgi:hypothetical protein
VFSSERAGALHRFQGQPHSVMNTVLEGDHSKDIFLSEVEGSCTHITIIRKVLVKNHTTLLVECPPLLYC